MKKRTITTILVILIFLLLIFGLLAADLLPKELMDSQGISVYAGIGIAVVILIGIIVFISKSKPGKKIKKEPRKSKYEEKQKIVEPKQQNNKREFEKNRNDIIAELKEAENQFLKHKISDETFNKITKDKNAELIKLEARIDSDKKLNMTIDDAKALDEVSKDKKNVLKGLLVEKQRKVHELKLSEKGYLKRKIDEKTYKKISEEVKAEIISIEGKIKSLQKSDEIDKIKMELLNGAKEIAKQQKSSKKRIAKEPLTFEDEVFEQIGFK